MEFRWCAGCGDDTVFETVPCEDGHGSDCPEVACVECGLALIGGWLLETVPVEHAVRRSA